MNYNFSVHVLGNGSASPNILRAPSAHWVKIEKQCWLIDCGEGTQFRMLEQGLKKSKLTGIAITHLHGDHYFGLFGLLTSMTLARHSEKLIIIAPQLLKTILETMLFQGGYQFSFEIDFIATDEVKVLEQIFQKEDVVIEAFPLKHRIHCCGFKFTYQKTIYHLKVAVCEQHNIPVKLYTSIGQGSDYVVDGVTIKNETLARREDIHKSYAYCSDTCYFPEIVNFVKNVDLLYHESTFAEAHADRATETFHSTAKQAATIAKSAEAKNLILGHFSARYDTLDKLLAEAKWIFPQSEIAEQGKVFEV